MTTRIFLVILLILSLHSPSFSSSNYSPPPQTYIIHVSPSHKPSHFLTHHHWYTWILHSLPPSQPPPHILYTYTHSTHGFSASLTSLQASHLLLHRTPAILSLYPDQIRHLHTTRTPAFLNLSLSSGLWLNTNSGDGVIVGILDTGIWPEHPSFSTSSGDVMSPVPSTWKGSCDVAPDFPASSCNNSNKIIGAKAYYKGYLSHLQSTGDFFDVTKESLSTRDTAGHGTHTASTSAGSHVSNASMFDYARGEAFGMASKAFIAAYKICWRLGCFDSDILAAMDQAIADGVHVISLSVGANGYSPQYDADSIAVGAFGAVENGVVVSCSAGNSGPRPFTAVNIAPWIITVGASTIDREFPADVVLGDGRVFGGVSLYSGDPLEDFNKLPLVYGADAGNKYCYMGGFSSDIIVQGKIVFCERGGNARVEKGAAVKRAGGLGMVLGNTAENGEELVADSHLLPATMVGELAANAIKEYIKISQFPTATIVFRGTLIGDSPPAPRVAAFSSRGPNHLTPEILKPDVIAPGVNILAGWTGAVGPTDLEIDPRRVEFNIISGTSMSCPHVSGIAALLRKAYPNWSPAAIKSALVTTAYSLDNSGNGIKDLASGKESSPYVHGAGHVDPNRALDPGLVYDIGIDDYVKFLCSVGYSPQRIAVFTRSPASLDVCRQGDLDSPGNLNYPSFSVVFGSDIDVVNYKRVVKNVGSVVDVVYEVKLDTPVDVHVKVSPTRLVFSAENHTLSYEVTFSSGVLGGWSGVKSPSFGAIEWSDGVHKVRSPVAVKWSQGGGSRESI